MRAGTRDAGEEWIYTVKPTERDKGGIHLKVQAGSVTMFGLPGTKQKNMPILWEGPIEEFVPAWVEKRHEEVSDSIPNDFIDEQNKKKGK